MNKERRKRIEQALTALNTARVKFEVVRDDEQEAFDNMPESPQGSDKGTTMEEGIQSLEDSISPIEEAKAAVAEMAEMTSKDTQEAPNTEEIEIIEGLLQNSPIAVFDQVYQRRAVPCWQDQRSSTLCRLWNNT
jgi:hypothetical protein